MLKNKSMLKKLDAGPSAATMRVADESRTHFWNESRPYQANVVLQQLLKQGELPCADF
jgi:hypothetical protein